MMNAQIPSDSGRSRPYKSVAAALLFSVFLGPVGLLYASFWGGFVMIAVGLVVLASKQFYPILLFWVFCSIWSVGAVEAYNKKNAQGLLYK